MGKDWQRVQEWRRDRARLAKLRYPKSRNKGVGWAVKYLRVETEYFCAGATFKRVYGVWSCVAAAPILRWMVGKTPDAIKINLLKMGANWEWTSPGSVRPRTTDTGVPAQSGCEKIGTDQQRYERTNPATEIAGERHCDIRGGISLQTDRSTTRLTSDSAGSASPRLVNDAVVPTTSGVPASGFTA